MDRPIVSSISHLGAVLRAVQGDRFEGFGRLAPHPGAQSQLDLGDVHQEFHDSGPDRLNQTAGRQVRQDGE